MPLFAFLDESGHYTFRPTDSNFLVFVGIVTSNPLLFTHEFAELKYTFLIKGKCQPEFHATEDAQEVRNEVFRVIEGTSGFSVHAIIVRKNKVNPSLYRFGVYSLAYKTLLKYLALISKIDCIHIIADIPPDKKQAKALKENLFARATEALTPAGVNLLLATIRQQPTPCSRRRITVRGRYIRNGRGMITEPTTASSQESRTNMICLVGA